MASEQKPSVVDRINNSIIAYPNLTTDPECPWAWPKNHPRRLDHPSETEIALLYQDPHYVRLDRIMMTFESIQQDALGIGYDKNQRPIDLKWVMLYRDQQAIENTLRLFLATPQNPAAQFRWQTLLEHSQQNPYLPFMMLN